MSEPLKKRDPDQQGSLDRIVKAIAASSAIVDYLEIVSKAVRRTVIPPRKEGEFFLGSVAGFVLSCIICLLLQFVVPVPAPMAVLFVMLPLTLASGLLFSRVFRFTRSIFKLTEERDLERADVLYRRKMMALEQRAAELKEAKLSPREIEEKLGETRDRVLAQHLDELDQIPAVRTQEILKKSYEKLGPGGRD